MSSNMQRLGDTLSSRMKKSAAGAIPTTLELGKINSNLSLSVDSIGTPIPRGCYMVDIRLTHDTYRTEKKSCGTCPEHDHRLPDVFRALKAGDRVLVAWVGHEPVVLAIVKNS